MNIATNHDEANVSYRLDTRVFGTLGMSQQQDNPSPAPTPTGDIEQESTGQSPSGGESETETESEERPETDLPLDQVFEILKNSRRRETLHYLEDNGGKASLSELAEHIAAIENDTTVSAISSSQRKRVYVGLYQCHLPKMDDMNIVDFDQNRGTIRRARNADQLDPYLEESSTPPWHRIYGAITVASGGLFAVSVGAGSPMGLTPSVVLAALIVAMAGCSAAHAVYKSRDESE